MMMMGNNTGIASSPMTWTVLRRQPFLQLCFQCPVTGLRTEAFCWPPGDDVERWSPPGQPTATPFVLHETTWTFSLICRRSITHTVPVQSSRTKPIADPWPLSILSCSGACPSSILFLCSVLYAMQVLPLRADSFQLARIFAPPP